MLSEDSAAERQRQLTEGQASLDWQKLYDWTESLPEGAVLGRSCTNMLDPLCTYLGNVTKTRPEVWSIGPSIKTGYGDRLQKPEWISRLIVGIDDATGYISKDITREMYLSILHRVEPEEK